MHPHDLHLNAKKLRYGKLEQEVFRWMRANLSSIMLDAQKDQLFRDSKGADGLALGYYKRNRGSGKRKGRPFDMVYTGKLNRTTQVRITNSYILFKADNAHILVLDQHTFWGTKEWFGLTKKNMDEIIDVFLKSEAINITRRVITTGVW